MRWTILIFLFFTMAINFADKSIVGYAAVSIMTEFDLNYAQWGLIGSSFFWFFSISGILGAAVSDRFGTKKIISIMLICWTVLQFGAFAITGLSTLILYRILLGAGEGPFAPTAISHVTKWFKPGQRGMAISIVNAGGMIGALASAPILVWLIQSFGWRVGFASLGLVSLVCLIVWNLLPATSKVSVQSIQEMAKPQKINWREFGVILKSPTCLFTLFAAFSGSWLTMWLSLWMPSYMTQVAKLTPTQMGYSALIIGLISVVVSIGISSFSDYLFKKTDNFRLSRVYVAGTALVIASLFLASITIFQSGIWVTFALSMAKGCAFTILAISPQVLMRLMPSRSGLMTSLSTSFMNIAGMIGPIIIGVLIELAGTNVSLGFSYSILLSAGLLALFGILFAIFVQTKTNFTVTSPQVKEDVPVPN